jgi:hypothetical protein
MHQVTIYATVTRTGSQPEFRIRACHPAMVPDPAWTPWRGQAHGGGRQARGAGVAQPASTAGGPATGHRPPRPSCSVTPA